MIYEVKAWMFRCTCGKEAGPVFSQYPPTIPADWSYREHHDCGLTGYSRTDIRCPDCTRRFSCVERESLEREATSSCSLPRSAG